MEPVTFRLVAAVSQPAAPLAVLVVSAAELKNWDIAECD